MLAVGELRTGFVGMRWPLFFLAFKTSILTVLTLGLYRFWMKTRLRRYYWSATRPGGHPLEYTGEPLEKLLGFLIAVVFLAFYIGVVNLLLMFLSFSLLQDNMAAYVLSFIGVIPVVFFAQYRARRYILGRTRWRGIRFAMEHGAWGYSWRAMVHWAITLLTLGILWPRMTFWLEKYRTDRTWYGDVRLSQGGSWTMLLSAARWLYVGLALTGGSVAYSMQTQQPRIGLILVGACCIVLGFFFYRAESLRILTNHKTAGGLSLLSGLRPWRVFWIYSRGYALVYAVIGILALGFFVIMTAALFSAAMSGSSLERLATLPEPLMIGLGVVMYFLIFVTWGVLTHVFVTLPLMRHYAETLIVKGATTLPEIRQRGRDDFAEAEGFADALDVGAAI